MALMDLARSWLRLFVTDGVPSSGTNQPDKDEGVAVFTEVETRLATLAAAQNGAAYQGTWNATTNSPTIPAAASGNRGFYYIVGIAGSTSIDSINSWAVGDTLQSNGTVWQKVAINSLVANKLDKNDGAATGNFVVPDPLDADDSFRAAPTKWVLRKIATLITLSGTDENYYWRITGANGVTAVGLHRLHGFVFENKDLDAKHARNIAYGVAANSRRMTAIPYLGAFYNLLMNFVGQSYSQGAQGTPPITGTTLDLIDGATAVDGNKMLGNDVRPSPSSLTTFVQKTPTGFQPAIAKAYNGDTLLAEADYATNKEAQGQTLSIQAINVIKKLYLQATHRASDLNMILVASAPGVGGTPLSDFLPGATAAYYNRAAGCVNQFFSEAAALGKTPANGGAQIACLLHEQGQSDTIHSGTARTRAEYLTQLETVYAALDVLILSKGQKVLPLIAFFIPDAGYLRDLDGFGQPDLFVAMAMQDFYQAHRDRCIILGPMAQTTDKTNLHPDANGYVQLGTIAGLRIAEALVHRRSYEPCWVIATETRGTTVDIHFNRNLMLGSPVYDGEQVYPGWTRLPGLSAGTFSSWGFRCRDANGVIGLATGTAPKLVRPSIVRLQLASAPKSGDGIYTVCQQSTGMTLLKAAPESIDTAFSKYVFQAGKGFWEGEDPDHRTANIPALVGKPHDNSEYVTPGFYPYNWERPTAAILPPPTPPPLAPSPPLDFSDDEASEFIPLITEDF